LETRQIPESKNEGLRVWALILPGVLYVALLFVWPLTTHWAADPQYHFGYLVPVLATLLAWRRWETRPAPSTPPFVARATLAVLLLLFLPAWLLLQPNPDWRLLNWLTSSMSVAFLLGIAALLGGRKWACHFAFPACFLLTAVPWPTQLEWPVTQGLMRAVASTAAELLSATGVPAIAQGNLVEIAHGTLGVDLACSGIRSLQPSIMIALFVGELFRFDLARRAGLLLASIAIAFLTNLGRVLLLAAVASRSGFAAIDQWHDPAGTVLMTICFALVWGLAALLSRHSASAPPAASVPPIGLPRPQWGIWSIAWIGLSVAASAAWFRMPAEKSEMPWSFAAPSAAQPVVMDAEALQMLRFDHGGGWKWRNGAGQEWIAYDMRWNSGSARSRLLLSMHRPDVCLAALGLRLREDRGIVWTESNATRVPFHAYVFDSARGPLHVYYALYRGGEPVLEHAGSAQNACLRAVSERRRVVDQHVLQLAVSGCGDAREADAALHEVLQSTVAPRALRSQQN
jgi:exosortase